MEYLLTAEEMRECDREAVEGGKVTGQALMDKAALGVAKVAGKLLGDVRGKRIAVLCGKGNNGGDGFGAAVYLGQMGAEVKVVLIGSSVEVSGDAKIFYDKVKNMSTEQARIEVEEFSKAVDHLDLNDFDLVIDAVLGTGLKDEPKDNAKKAIAMMTEALTQVLSVDVPSGLDSNTGTVHGAAPHPVATATMGYAKRGLVMNDGKDCSGDVYIVDIGMPASLAAMSAVQTLVITGDDVRHMLPRRKSETYKHAVGKVFALVGSVGMTGAGIMVGRAAMRSGAGTVVLGVPSELNVVYESQLTEVMTIPLPQTGDGSLSLAVLLQIRNNLEWADVLVIGPGLSRNQETSQLIAKVLRSYDGKMVIDADGLNAIADQPGILSETAADIILTPHHGEFSRITGFSVEDIAKDRIEMARNYARENKVTLVLKGSPTVIASKEGEVYVNVHGNPGMATAGMGDVLTGTIAAMVSQKLSMVNASIAGVYLHSVAGDLAVASKGIYSLISSDVIETLPEAFRKVDSGELVEFQRAS
ncbi:MAG: NAD(P)H-hydrate dehydratase [Bacteroidetes bacterium]|nr:NAD(P)H-hydrate dehydratase [Bacteroidota bacterium]